MQINSQMVGSKVERQNSFALYGTKRNAPNFGSHKMSQPVYLQLQGLRRESTGDAAFHVREPNDTAIMKARPATSIRVASAKSHGGNQTQGGYNGHYASSSGVGGTNFKFGNTHR